MLLLSTLVLVLNLLILIIFYVKRRWDVLTKWHIPHDSPSIFQFGHQSLLFGDTDTTEYYLKCKQKYGNVWGYYVVTQPVIVVHDLDLLKRIMIEDSTSSFPNRLDRTLVPVEDILFSGLVFATGKQWKRTRTTLTPAFTTSKLKDMCPMMEKCIDWTLQVVADELEISGGEIRITDVCGKLSLDVICAAAFGTDVNAAGEEGQLFSKRAELFDNAQVTALPMLLITAFPSLRPFVNAFLLKHRRGHMDYLSAFCETVAKQRQKCRAEMPRDLLQLMLESRIDESSVDSSQKGLVDFEIVANSLTMLLAGRNTVSNSMTYLAYNLAMYPEIQTKLQNEIDQHYTKHNNLDWEVVSQMKYLDMCILESLRLYCPFSRIRRRAKRTVTIGGFTFFKGTSVEVPIQALSRDPNFWHNPIEYDPERFRDPSSVNTMVYQPFGNGPRVCIGRRMAIMEMKMFFSRLLQKYNLRPSVNTPAPPLPVLYLFSTRPKSPVKLNLELRSKTE